MKDPIRITTKNTPSAEYINFMCRQITDQRCFCYTDFYDMERMMKFMGQRGLSHRQVYCPKSNTYTAVVEVPLQEPVTIIATDKHPAIAYALCGVKLAEMAGF